MTDKQYGGWYDNPETGQNQRWWGNNSWTNGSEPGSSSNTAETVDERLKARSPDDFDAIHEFIDEMKGEFKDNYELLVSFLKDQFETALGNEDTDGAKFLASVANEYEKRVGRIPYDYELLTDREKEDFRNFQLQKDAEDDRQRQQEKEFMAQQKLASEKEQRDVRYGANERGMLNSGIEKRQAEETKTARETNIINPQLSTFAYQQAMREEERRLGALVKDRHLADLTTNARRLAEDALTTRDQGLAQADLTLAQKLAEIDRLGDKEKITTLSALNQEAYV